MVEEWEVQRQFDGEWHHYHLLHHGRVTAWGKWRKSANDPTAAEFHNATFLKTKSVLMKTRDVFELIKSDMKSAGCTVVVVSDLSGNVDATRRKYWSFMGFKFSTDIGDYTCAVMEV